MPPNNYILKKACAVRADENPNIFVGVDVMCLHLVMQRNFVWISV